MMEQKNTDRNFDKEKSGRTVESALISIITRWSKFRDLLYPLTNKGLPLESKLDYTLLAYIALFYIRVKFGLLRKKVWSN